MRDWISRAIAGPIAAGVGWLLSTVGANVAPEHVSEPLTDAATWLIIGLVTGAYGYVHKKIDRRVNPTDDAVKRSPLGTELSRPYHP